MRRETVPSETVLITGASSGIGLELAKLFAADKSNLILVARSQDKLDQLATELHGEHGVRVRVLTKDLADPQSPQAVFDALAAESVTVDVLVNNAGFGAGGSVADLPLGRQVDMIQVNVAALTHLTRLFLPGMIQRRSGGILNVASVAAFQPGPYMAVYYATKAYVLSFTEALAEEVIGTGVRVTCFAPGLTATGFAAVADVQRQLLSRLWTADAKTVARAGYRGFGRGRLLVIPGLRNKLGAVTVRFTPRLLVRKVIKRLQTYTTPKGEFDKAIAAYTEAIRLDPKCAEAYWGRGWTYEKKGDYDQAIADFSEVIRLSPRLSEAYCDRGIVYGKKGSFDEAIADFTEAIRLAPQYTETYGGQGSAYGQKGDLGTAIADFTDAIRLNPKLAEAYYNRGLAYQKMGDTAKAESDFAQANTRLHESPLPPRT
jgi:short-subunit dehydrogenase/lipoprotein NlpI